MYVACKGRGRGHDKKHILHTTVITTKNVLACKGKGVKAFETLCIHHTMSMDTGNVLKGFLIRYFSFSWIIILIQQNDQYLIRN